MDLSQINSLYIENIQKSPNQEASAQTKELEPDSFEKAEQTQDVPYNTYDAPPRCNINFTDKKTLAVAVTVSSAAIITGVMAVLLHKKSNAVKVLQSELEDAQASIQKLKSAIPDAGSNENNSAAIKKLNETIDALKKQISKLTESEENVQILKNDRIKHYKDLIDGCTLDYDPLKPDLADKKDTSWIFFNKVIPFKDCSGEITPKTKSSFIDDLISKFRKGEDIDIPLVKKPNTEDALRKASLENSAKKQFLRVGQTESSHIALNYGTNSTNWSNEKISRDILQNFYDANNYSLDGVGLSVRKGVDGYKIKVSGNGVYDVSSLLEMGSGSKLQDSMYNAGGFGEGSRIVATNIIAKGKAKNIRYASADWIKEFSASDGSLVEKIDRAPELLDGNYVEFTTKDKGLAESIIKSFDFFKHSKNADFKGLNFEDKNFAFKILNPGQNGNLYMTQRFEYNGDGAWQDGLEGLSLIFKRKPNMEEFQSVTGKPFNVGRDRSYFSPQEVHDLTEYFALEMSDEDLAKAISLTKEHWLDLSVKVEDKKGIVSFVNALCDAAKKRRLGIDFSKEKVCQLDPIYNDRAVVESVRGLGYKIIPKEYGLNKIGMPTVNDIKGKMSAHTAINPTETEIKKMKLLEEATRVIQEGIDKSCAEQVKSVYNNAKKFLKPENPIDTRQIMYDVKKTSFAESSFAKKYENLIGYSIKDEEIDIEKFTADLIEFLDKEVKALSEKESDKADELGKIISGVLDTNKEKSSNTLIGQYCAQLKNMRIILPEDVSKPRYIFDRTKEVSKNTLGEAIINNANYSKTYEGHWIDKEHLDDASFHELISTWLHEICHKSGGDGTAEFTYKLTDLIAQLTEAFTNSNLRTDLSAIETVFNSL